MGGNDTPPLCECHGEPKAWRSDSRKAKGGYWYCATKRRATQTAWEKTEKGHALRLANVRRNGKTAKGRAAKMRYEKSEKGRAARAKVESNPHRKLQKQLRELTRIRVRY